MGDFNFPNIHWIDGSAFSHCTTNDENRLVDILKDLYLFKHIQSPTRLASVLDLILTNNSDSISSLQSGVVVSEIGIPSDHYPIVLNIGASHLFKTPAKSLRYKLEYENLAHPRCKNRWNSQMT